MLERNMSHFHSSKCCKFRIDLVGLKLTLGLFPSFGIPNSIQNDSVPAFVSEITEKVSKVCR